MNIHNDSNISEINRKERIAQLISEIEAMKDELAKLRYGKFSERYKESASFYRYIRPIFDFTGEVDSQRGVTLKVELDYVGRELMFSYSICNHKHGEASFSKFVGRAICDDRQMIKLPLWEEGPLLDQDVVSYIISHIKRGDVNIPQADAKNIVEQFEYARHNFYA